MIVTKQAIFLSPLANYHVLITRIAKLDQQFLEIKTS